ncbi:MAG TPA: hypothetical protein ENK23_01585, partial [Sorangium sp.]|nr:hypothetical protein [Sorangium sp.]
MSQRCPSVCRRTILCAPLLLAAGCDGCRAAVDADEAIPEGLSVAVEIDGQPAAVIDTAKLRVTTPDHRDGGRRAWRLSSLLGEVYHPDEHSVS